MTRLLITGGAGQLAMALCNVAKPHEFTSRNASRQDLDITDEAAVNAEIDTIAPDFIINTAAYTAVDKAESERQAAFAVNAGGAELIARAANAHGIPLIHVSTDYVFDGTKPAPYVEDDPVAPINVYGESKLAGETAVRAHCPHHIIVRTAWVCSRHGGNFVKTMLAAATRHPELKVVADQIGTPTFAGDLALAILQIIAQLDSSAAPWGTYHCANSGETSWFGFANAIFDTAADRVAKRPVVHPCTTADYPTAAHRPANSRLNTAKLATTFGIAMRPWDEALTNLIDELLPERPAT